MDDTENFLLHMQEKFIENGITRTNVPSEKPRVTENKRLRLPPIIQGNDFPAQYDLEKRPPLVENLFRAKDNVLLGAPSKMGKSWFYANLAVCLASGRHFIDLEVKKSRVLIIDLELHRDDALDRLWRIAHEEGHNKMPEFISMVSQGLSLRFRFINNRVGSWVGIDRGIDAIILDPIYMLGDAG